MEKKNIAIIVGLFFVAIVSYMMFANVGWKDTIEMQLQISDYGGFNVDTDKLYFGTVTAGGGSRRNITIENIFDRDLRVILSARGELAKYTSFSNNRFDLPKGETISVEVKITTPKTIADGNYTGKTIIFFKEI